VTPAENVTQWLANLSDGDERAAQAIWERYFDKLVRYARRKLRDMPRRAADEEDIALSAMKSFYQGMAEGRFPKVDDREDLWKLLVTITARKVCAQWRREHAQKRGGGGGRGESAFMRRGDDADAGTGIGEVLGSEPTPELAAMVAENCEQLFAALEDETLRRIARYKLEGWTNREIAESLGCVRETVERKLKRIRMTWSEEIPS